MSVLSIRTPQAAANAKDILRQKAVKVRKIDDSVRTLLSDMTETLASAGGLGLAAPQVGARMRMFVVKNGAGFLKFVNPSITRTEGRQDSQEACLSLPGVYGKVKRPSKVTIRALDEFGRPFELEATGRMACTLSHEYDHLDGILFIDRASTCRRTDAP
jgi:peptide deformylase